MSTFIRGIGNEGEKKNYYRYVEMARALPGRASSRGKGKAEKNKSGQRTVCVCMFAWEGFACFSVLAM